ncbi:hypothetical protein EAS54_02060 [Bradyrhizobium guangzhouense]|nr:hypothetical protein EAS54_02060 [Bradyrhizobium guangzhouense]
MVAWCGGIGTILPLPLAGEGRGEGVSATGQSTRGRTLTRRARISLRVQRECFTPESSGSS